MVRSDGATLTNLPNARWADEAPLVLQSLLVRSIAATGRIGYYVGRSEGGPVPDAALLVRMDAFEVIVGPGGEVSICVEFDLTIVNDRDQRVLGRQSFAQLANVVNDGPPAITGAFQAALNVLLPSAAEWILQVL